MKNLKVMLVALVAMCGLNSCSEDCDHNYIEHDFTQDIVGTWTFLEDDLAEAMVIKADGSFTTTGVARGGSLYEEKGTIKVENNKVTLAFDGDKDTFEGRLEFVAGKSLSLVMFDDNDVRLTYDYCENDLSDEIVGMWVCNDGPTSAKGDMMIQVFNADGSSVMTGHADELLVNDKSTSYKVVGDLVFLTMNKESVKYETFKMTYSPNGTAYGDIMTLTLAINNANIAPTTTWLRVKQNLDLTGNTYDYIKTFVSNVKGEDKDIPFLNSSFNFAKMNGAIIDKFLKSTLFAVEFPDANTLKYSFLVNGQTTPMTAPIEVEDNKMTIKMSVNGDAYHDVELYAFQDQDNTQMHLYMPTASFEKFFANTSVYVMLGNGQLDKNDADAIAAVYKNVADAVESINLSLVMSKEK